MNLLVDSIKTTTEKTQEVKQRLQLQINCVLSISRSFVVHKNCTRLHGNVVTRRAEARLHFHMEGRSFVNWVFQFSNEFKLIMHIRAIECRDADNLPSSQFNRFDGFLLYAKWLFLLKANFNCLLSSDGSIRVPLCIICDVNRSNVTFDYCAFNAHSTSIYHRFG